MHNFLIPVLLAVSLTFQQDAPDPRAVRIAVAPEWILPPPAPSASSAPDGAAVRVIYSDNQVRIGSQGTENFLAYRVKILKPEGLVVGNVSMAWNPAAGGLTVHRLHIVRGDHVTDVLSSTSFRVLQREEGLETSMLDGWLTASIQAPGLQVGDELEFAATLQMHDPTLGDHVYGTGQLPVNGQPGAFRFRLLWPTARHLIYRGTTDLVDLQPKTLGDYTELVYEIRDPKSAALTDQAPARLNQRRRIDYSDYDGWSTLSRQLAPLFERAAALGRDSLLGQEVARIAAQSPDPAARAIAALKLVQNQVRYVYVGLDGGNFRPAAADETWSRRFGDCKAKTVLLLALLRQLGVPAEAALVSTENGDGIDARLPTPGLFDHAVVRATIGERSYWLDGTGLGAISLVNLPHPLYRWALTLDPKDGGLVAVPLEPADQPQMIEIADLDATAGFDAPAKIKTQRILRGDKAEQYRAALSGLPTDAATRALKNYWAQENWGLAETVAWHYDEAHAALVLSMSGESKLDWRGDAKVGRTLSLLSAGFMPPPERKRPDEQDQKAPWVTEFPRFTCWVTTTRLPPDPTWTWRYSSPPIERKLGGASYWRTADLRNNTMRTIMSKRFYQPELSAAEAAEVNASIAGFDNKMSQVYQVSASQGATRPSYSDPPFTDETDWLSSTSLCASSKPLVR
jgi:transglutaminase-like putative cysteine protease